MAFMGVNTESLPPREAWIEIIRLWTLIKKNTVASPAGSVD